MSGRGGYATHVNSRVLALTRATGWFTTLAMLSSLAASAGLAADRFALILSDPPVTQQFRTKAAFRSTAATAHRDAIRAAQSGLRNELRARRIPATGAAQLTVNAVFVHAAPEREAELRALPGVVSVVRVRRYKLKLNRALEMANVPAAWAMTGSPGNAGQGVKIAVLDTGIDLSHPAFNDDGYKPLDGFPRCSGYIADDNCAGFTNRKVIVARSYVSQLAAADNGAADDYTPRDHVGHGTATAATAAATPVMGPFGVQLSGVAPRAYLGIYRIYGTPGVNGFTSDEVMIQAFEDALADDMDVVSFSVGMPALTAPLTATCGPQGRDVCDLLATALESLTGQGLLVVAAAGNEGASGFDEFGEPYSTHGSVTSPATLSSVLSVGAITSSRQFTSSVLVAAGPGSGALRVPAYFALESAMFEPLTAPVADVAQIGDNGRLCGPVDGSPLAGRIAIIARGGCTFKQKTENAVQAGAVGVIFYQAGPEPFAHLISIGMDEIVAVMITAEDARTLLAAIAGDSSRAVTLDPSLSETENPRGNLVASFSSRGPTIAEGLAKPDLAAPGTTIVVPTQTQDIDGSMYSDTGYTIVDGTSFSTPIVAGAAAVVRQLHPEYSAAQIRSVLVNTASSAVGPEDARTRVTEVGAGKLDLKRALQTNVAVEPPSLSFGILTPTVTFPLQRTFKLSSIGTSPQTFLLTVEAANTFGGAISVEPASVSLNPRDSANITVKLSGSPRGPGHHDGYIKVAANNVDIRIPYLFSIGDGRPVAIVPLTGNGFVGIVSERITDVEVLFRIIDRYGIGVPGVPVNFTPVNRRGRIAQGDRETDALGIARAIPIMPATPGPVTILGSANFGELQFEFFGYAEAIPVVRSAVDAADRKEKPFAPGSLISVLGTGLSDVYLQAPDDHLPMALDTVTVSFHAANGSWPGWVHYISPEEVTVQVPWELQGQRNVQIRTGNFGIFSERFELALAAAPAPSVFTQTDDSGLPVVDAMGIDNQPTGLQTNPARRGQPISVYANGLGPVRNRADATSPTVAMPLVTVGGVQAEVLSSRLATDRAGYYEVKIRIANETPAGLQDLVLAIGGITAEAVKMNVR